MFSLRLVFVHTKKKNISVIKCKHHWQKDKWMIEYADVRIVSGQLYWHGELIKNFMIKV